jgi:serine/threonine protein kinase
VSEAQPEEEPEELGDSSGADRRMADVLRESEAPAQVRRRLQGEDSDEASDVLSRLNALDFVEQVVGGPAELPDHVGAYEIRGQLGRGGMGTVYLGWQSDLEREVALKVLSRDYTADPTMRKRFRAEARATAALHHRHIVPIYDYGEANGLLYFAMERVDGMSLDKHVRAARRVEKAPMEPLDAARRFAGVADALGLAHRRRLLHRDVKPGNILVGHDGTLALTDFGLAKALDHTSMQLTTKGGGFLGTLHYASPEQALGAELTPASDLYSLGVTIFEALTGHLPLGGTTAESLLQSILHGTPHRLRDFVPKPPRDLDAVLQKLLSREPADRYQDGEELSRDLARVADGDPVQIRRIPLRVRAWRRARKNPVLAGALVAVAIFVAATLSLLGVLSREKGKGRESRHQNRLVAIARDVGLEQGSPWGPRPLFTSLTGQGAPAVGFDEGVLAGFAVAQDEVPDDVRVLAMEAAYVEDPSPRASRFLEAGRGFEAIRVLDDRIADAIARRTGGDLAAEIALFRLYLGRGVARLTASVARPGDARTDLALATYLRPGAVFPKVVLDVLDLVQSSDVVGAAGQLERALADAAPERVQACATLLWTAAGHLRPLSSNMMDFGLDHRGRRAAHELAARLLEEAPAPCVRAGAPTGLASQFSEGCASALDNRADPAKLRAIVDPLARLVTISCAPAAQLHGWRHLLQLVSRPRQRGPLTDELDRPLGLAEQEHHALRPTGVDPHRPARAHAAAAHRFVANRDRVGRRKRPLTQLAVHHPQRPHPLVPAEPEPGGPRAERAVDPFERGARGALDGLGVARSCRGPAHHAGQRAQAVGPRFLHELEERTSLGVAVAHRQLVDLVDDQLPHADQVPGREQPLDPQPALREERLVVDARDRFAEHAP